MINTFYFQGRVHVKDGKVIKMVRDHFHAPCGTSVNVAKVVAAVKRTAAQRELHTSTVVNMAMAGTSEAVQALAPVNRNLKQTVYRVRKKLSPDLPSPSDLAGLVIPEQFRFYKYNITQKEPYLLSDSGPTEKRILIFGRYVHNCFLINYIHNHNQSQAKLNFLLNFCFRQSWLRFLAQSPVCYGDGTFKLAPPMFHQVFVLMAKRQGGIFPIVYVLLPDKRQVTYKKMFDMIIELVPEFQPMKFSCDFEMAVINAVKVFSIQYSFTLFCYTVLMCFLNYFVCFRCVFPQLEYMDVFSTQRTTSLKSWSRWDSKRSTRNTTNSHFKLE